MGSGAVLGGPRSTAPLRQTSRRRRFRPPDELATWPLTSSCALGGSGIAAASPSPRDTRTVRTPSRQRQELAPCQDAFHRRERPLLDLSAGIEQRSPISATQSIREHDRRSSDPRSVYESQGRRALARSACLGLRHRLGHGGAGAPPHRRRRGSAPRAQPKPHPTMPSLYRVRAALSCALDEAEAPRHGAGSRSPRFHQPGVRRTQAVPGPRPTARSRPCERP